jgi:hypothetical protein
LVSQASYEIMADAASPADLAIAPLAPLRIAEELGDGLPLVIIGAAHAVLGIGARCGTPPR